MLPPDFYFYIVVKFCIIPYQLPMKLHIACHAWLSILFLHLSLSCLQIPPYKISRQQVVVWIKDGHVIMTLGTKKYLHYRRRKELVIRSLNEMDSGIYECAISLNSTERGRAEIVGESNYSLTLLSMIQCNLLTKIVASGYKYKRPSV